jgi:cytochrome c biogenesis protein CcmG, thiol:disulfide interchange protein DsbE
MVLMDGDTSDGGALGPAQARVHRRGARLVTAAVAFAVGLAVFGAGGVMAMRQGGGQSRPGTFVQASLPASVLELRGTDLSGRPVAMSRFANTPLVVGFFGSWCGPCRRDAPAFASLAERFSGRISLLSVAVSDTSSADRAFAARYGWTWSIVEDTGFRWSVAFGVPGVPTTYVLRPDGSVADRIVGPVILESLARDIRSLLGSG